MPTEIMVSIVILTKNGAKYLNQVLSAVFEQQFDYGFEVIIIDSGSKDNTLEIIKSYPIKLLQIPAQQFNHGKTRDLGASMAQGELVVYLTQDAVPANKLWLKNLVSNLISNQQVAGVTGRHQPRLEASPLVKAEVNNTKVIGFNKNLEISLAEGDEFSLDKHQFFNNNNSAIRKSVWQKINFGDCYFGEDVIWTEKVLKAGWSILYQADAVVSHSHEYTASQYLKRCVDTAQFLRCNFKRILCGNLLFAVYLYLATTVKDGVYLYHESGLLWSHRFFGMFQAIYYNVFRVLGYYLGSKQHLPEFLNNRLSLQKQIISQ